MNCEINIQLITLIWYIFISLFIYIEYVYTKCEWRYAMRKIYRLRKRQKTINRNENIANKQANILASLVTWHSFLTSMIHCFFKWIHNKKLIISLNLIRTEIHATRQCHSVGNCIEHAYQCAIFGNCCTREQQQKKTVNEFILKYDKNNI